MRPPVDAFLDRYPSVQVRLLLLDRVVNVIDEGMDVAVRIGHLPDSGLIAIKVGEVRRLLCASPGYLDRRKAPRAPTDLKSHDCISFNAMTPSDVWTFAPGTKAKASTQVRVFPRLTVTEAEAAIGAAVDGHGVTRVLSYQVERELKAGRLKVILEENRTAETLRNLQAEGKVRFIGMSGILPNLPDHLAMGIFDVFQIPYSAVQRDHEELITEAADAGAGTFIRGGAARGAASEDKNWRAGPLSQDPGVGQRNWETSGIAGLLSEAGMSNMEFVLRFTLSHPGLSTTIVGTSNPAHLASNIAIAEKGPLPADLYEEAKKRLPLP